MVEIRTDENLDVYVVEGGECYRVSTAGHPVPAVRVSPNTVGSLGMFVRNTPSAVADLMKVHGCNLDDLELDQEIWAAAYARHLDRLFEAGRHESGAAIARTASRRADQAVRVRWLAKGGE